MQPDAVAVALGFAIGILSGLFGVGGSSIATPLLRVTLNTPSLIALASPLPGTFPTAVAGLAGYRKEGLVNRRAVVWSVVGGLPAVVVGALLTRWIPGHWLMILVAVAVAGVGVEMLRLNPYTASELTRRSTRWRNASIAGERPTDAAIVSARGLLRANAFDLSAHRLRVRCSGWGVRATNQGLNEEDAARESGNRACTRVLEGREGFEPSTPVPKFRACT
jgi:Sulfite exporter TauE/SafE